MQDLASVAAVAWSWKSLQVVLNNYFVKRADKKIVFICFQRSSAIFIIYFRIVDNTK